MTAASGSGFEVLVRTMDALPYDETQLRIAVGAGVCQLEIRGAQTTFCHLVRAESGPIRLAAGSHPHPNATVTLQEDTLIDLIINKKDWRELQTLGRYHLDQRGDLGLVRRMFRYIFDLDGELCRRHFRIVEQRVSKRGAFTEVERVESPSQSVLDEAEQLSKPLVVTGALTHWKAVRWTFEFLARAYPDAKLLLKGSLVTMQVFAQRVLASDPESGDVPYSSGSALPRGLEQDLRGLPYFTGRYGSPAVWMGAAGHVSPLHRDAIDGILTQCAGRKLIKLYSPDQSAFLYPESRFASGFQNCFVDPMKPDPEKFPLFVNARAVEFILNPGELLFLPIGWFHWVKTLDHAISVKFFPRKSEFDARLEAVAHQAG